MPETVLAALRAPLKLAGPSRRRLLDPARSRASDPASRRTRKLATLAALSLLAIALYMLVDLDMGNARLLSFALGIRTPKVIAMIIAGFAIGSATIVFQTIINNTVVTPCLLGMNALYVLIHTGVFFLAGSGSALAVNANLSFAVDLLIMAIAAVLIYGYLFEKTGYNVLYVLLIGTVLTSFFGSIQSALVRVMDPNEYDSLLSTIVASFSNVNSQIIAASIIAFVCVAVALRRELALLDVIGLGKDQAINLGVDYDHVIRRLLLGVVLFIAAATAMVGPISFLGLIIANLARQLMVTYRHGQLIASASLFGVIALVAGQLVVERVFAYAVPISVFVTVGGGIYFLYLLLRMGKA